MLKAILWDNDGVLVDTEALFLRANQEVLAQAGVRLSRDDFVRHSLVEGRSVLELARARGLGDAEIEDLRARRNARHAELLRADAAPIEGVEGILRAFHGRVAQALVTSSRRDHLEIAHARTGFLRFFDLVLTGGDYRRHKPHPEPYLLALERLVLRPEECVVVEDSERGLRAARAAGLRCVVVPHALTGAGDFREAHLLCGGVAELRDALQELVG